MGNCSIKGVVGDVVVGGDSIRVMSDSGRVTEFEGPIKVRDIMNEHPGKGVFRKGRLSTPLLYHEQLFNGQMYYLLPLKKNVKEVVTSNVEAQNSPSKMESPSKMDVEPVKQISPSASSSDLKMIIPMDSQSKMDVERVKQISPRVSSDLTMTMPMESALQVLPNAGDGVWRVKLVIGTKQLEEILSEQVNIEALIEKMRMVASTRDATTPRPSRMKIPWGLHWRPTTISSVIKVKSNISNNGVDDRTM